MLDHSQQALLPIVGSNGTYLFNQLLPTTRDEMLKDIRAIAGLKHDEIIFTELYVFTL